MINNTIVRNVNSLPGSRIFLKFIMDFNLNFDRLQLYYFHRQNFT